MATQSNLFPTIGNIAAQTDEISSVLEDYPADNPEEKAVQEIESMCMKCEEQGITRLMLTSIPFFREVIVMSFRCEHCGWTNNEIQSAGEIRPEGTLYTARIVDRSDLNRQIVRSPTCEVIIPEFDLTLPPTSRGQLTTVEGLIRDITSDLSIDQPLRRLQDESSYEKIQNLIDMMKNILGNDDDDEEEEPKMNMRMKPFTVKLDDPSGNSFIEYVGNMADPKWNLCTYHRTLNQNIALGLVSEDDQENSAAEAVDVNFNNNITDDEVLVFLGKCSSCGRPIENHMKKVNIPYFQDILIMSTNCEYCGYRDNEVKSGSAISEKGKRIVLRCEDRDDLSRDILKSETAGLTVPEIDLVLTHGTLGGRFTTVEGILEQIYEELAEKVFAGDSSEEGEQVKFSAFLKRLKEIKSAERPFTIILDDPLANSYIQSLYAPDPDPNLTIETYKRTFEQDEELGLNDIQVENYDVEETPVRS